MDTVLEKFEWHIIDKNKTATTYRAQVPGGWLIRVRELQRYNIYTPGEGTSQESRLKSNSITFLADPNHTWRIPHEN